MAHSLKDHDINSFQTDEELQDWVRKLSASVVRRAPMDATNVLLDESDEIIIAFLSNIEPLLARKILRHFPSDRAEIIAPRLTGSIGEQWELNLSYPEDSIGRLMEPAAGILEN